MMRESGKNLLLLIVSFGAVFLVLEISLRVYYGNQPLFLLPQVPHIHTAYGHKPAPNQKPYTLDQPVVTNVYGFRDYEWEMPKPPGRIRIMCVGDSLTFGNAAPFQAIDSKVLERMLKKQNPNIEVITAAVTLTLDPQRLGKKAALQHGLIAFGRTAFFSKPLRV